MLLALRNATIARAENMPTLRVHRVARNVQLESTLRMHRQHARIVRQGRRQALELQDALLALQGEVQQRKGPQHVRSALQAGPHH